MTHKIMLVCLEDESTYAQIRVIAVAYYKARKAGMNVAKPQHTAFALSDGGGVFQNSDPCTRFMIDKFCGQTTILERMKGNNTHKFTKLTKKHVKMVLNHIKKLRANNALKAGLKKYLRSHIGKHISVEVW